MALLTKHIYANKLYAHLAAAATNSQTTLTFYPEEIANLLSSWESGSWLYLCLMATDGTVEIVKMTGLSGNTLTVERGQGGTTARAWAAGTLAANRVTAEYLTRFLQWGVHRSGDYNPNDTLAGEYTGEKFLQTGPAEGQKRWWINTTGTKWRLLTGSVFTNEYVDADGYVIQYNYWEPFPGRGTAWNVDRWDAAWWSSAYYVQLLKEPWGWTVDYRPGDIKIQADAALMRDVFLFDEDELTIANYGWKDPREEVIETSIGWVTADLRYLRVSSDVQFSVIGIWFEESGAWVDYLR